MTKKEAASTALVGMIDELGDLEREVQPYRIKIARAEALRAAVRASFRGCSEPNVAAEGKRWRVLLGPAGNQSTVDVPALVKLIGPALFAKLATVTVKALQTHCPPDVLGAVVSTEPNGPRSLTLTPLN